jgi:AI-2 transport protein TqsA
MTTRNFIIYPALLVGLFYLLHVGKSLLIPLVIAIFIWYLINTLTEVLAKVPLGRNFRLPRGLAFSGALLIIASLIYFFVSTIAGNISKVVAAAPAYQQNLELAIQRLLAALPVKEHLDIGTLMGGVNLASLARSMAMELTNFLGRGAIVILYLIFLFLEQRSFEGKLLALVEGTERQKVARSIISRIDRDIRMYLGIKTLTSLATGVLSYMIFSVVGLDYAEFWAFMIFLFNFIPTIGSIIATILPSLLALVQFDGIGPFLVVIIGVTVVQQAIGSFLEPRLMGDQLNLSPLVILLSLALWGRLWGISGMFLCVPMTAVTMIILSHFAQTRPLAVALSRKGKIKTEN